ncbi:hypothetical protein AAMO2058_000157900 [Amorphochlora amoebiformis]
MTRASSIVGNTRCLITQLVSCLDLQTELKAYRARFESEAEMLKKINYYQRTEENLNAAMGEKDALIQELRDSLKDLEIRFNDTREDEKDDNKDDQAKSSDNSEEDKKAEQEVEEDQMKNQTFLLPNRLTRESAPVGIPVGIITDSNLKEQKKTIESLIKGIPATGFPVFISQYGTENEMSKMIQSYLMKDKSRQNIYHLQFSNTTTATTPGASSSASSTKPATASVLSAARRSNHLYRILSTLFDSYGYAQAIVLDDYLDTAFDFFDYFQATSKLFEKDPSIMCVSAWNENGQAEFAKDSGTLHRTDVFPDYAWMIDADFWREVKTDWPQHGDWKAWIRTRDKSKGRSCVIPEVCRVSVRKRSAAGDHTYYDQYLSKIKLNKNPVKFATMDLDFLKKPTYNAYIYGLVRDSTNLTSASSLQNYRGKPGDIKLEYEGTSGYVSVSRMIGLPSVLKDGHPPASYQGIVIIRYGTWRLFIVPQGWEKRMYTEVKARKDSEKSVIATEDKKEKS